VIGLKENQLILCKETEEYFSSALETPQFYQQVTQTVTHDKGHGRIEKREYYLCADPEFLSLHPEWKDLRSVGMVKSRIIQAATIGEETRYYISSLTDVNEFAHAVRCHWGIENSLHWCLDVTFREDHSRMCRDHSAENFAVVRHIVLNVLKNMLDKMSVARRRHYCSYDDDYLAKVLFAIHA
jgi:predicted transposase YbfD/YdcC